MRLSLIATCALSLAACQPAGDRDPGELPPDAPAPAEAEELAPPPETGAPSAAAPAFVGTWAANPAWCGNTSGPERPIVVTQTAFRGYENICEITELQPADDEWTATFVCTAEGSTTRQPVGIEADADELEITWVEDGRSVEWRRCPA